MQETTYWGAFIFHCSQYVILEIKLRINGEFGMYGGKGKYTHGLYGETYKKKQMGMIGADYNKFNLLKTKRRLLYLKTHFVPRSKHFSSRL